MYQSVNDDVQLYGGKILSNTCVAHKENIYSLYGMQLYGGKILSNTCVTHKEILYSIRYIIYF